MSGCESTLRLFIPLSIGNYIPIYWISAFHQILSLDRSLDERISIQKVVEWILRLEGF